MTAEAEAGFRFGPKELPAGRHNSRLVIALDADGLWNVVYYQCRHAGDHVGRRYAIVKSVLLDGLRVVFAEADEPYDADAVIAYIQATSWGAPLPRLTAKREPVPMPQDERDAEAHGWSPEG